MRQMPARPGAGQCPIAGLSLLQRWRWRRVQRRVIAEHERWVLDMLRRLAAEQVRVFPAFDRPSSPDAAGIVRLDPPGWCLLLAGVAPGARAPCGFRRIGGSGSGRRGRSWNDGYDDSSPRYSAGSAVNRGSLFAAAMAAAIRSALGRGLAALHDPQRSWPRV